MIFWFTLLEINAPLGFESRYGGAGISNGINLNAMVCVLRGSGSDYLKI
jgi:hypothetical protein